MPVIKGNPKGYNPKTSPLHNTLSKGGYEKKLDTVGSKVKSLRMLDGKGNVIGQERLNSAAASKLAEKYKKEKFDTESRRKTNLEFLQSKKVTGKIANKSIMKKDEPVKAKDGKCIQKAINPKHKGFCTPQTKATCTPKRKALAQTLRKIAKKK